MDSQLLPIHVRFIALLLAVLCPAGEDGRPTEGGLAQIISIGFAYLGTTRIPVMQAIVENPLGRLCVIEVYAQPVPTMQGKLTLTFNEVGACAHGTEERTVLVDKIRNFLMGTPAGVLPLES